MRREQIQIRDKEVEVEKATNKKEGQQMEQKVGLSVSSGYATGEKQTKD